MKYLSFDSMNIYFRMKMKQDFLKQFLRDLEQKVQ